MLIIDYCTAVKINYIKLDTIALIKLCSIVFFKKSSNGHDLVQRRWLKSKQTVNTYFISTCTLLVKSVKETKKGNNKDKI